MPTIRERKKELERLGADLEEPRKVKNASSVGSDKEKTATEQISIIEENIKKTETEINILEHPIFKLAGFKEEDIENLLQDMEAAEFFTRFSNLLDQGGDPEYTDFTGGKHRFYTLKLTAEGLIENLHEVPSQANEFKSLNILLNVGEHFVSLHIPADKTKPIEYRDPMGGGISDVLKAQISSAFDDREVIANTQRLQQVAGPCGVFAGMNLFQNVFLLEMEGLVERIKEIQDILDDKNPEKLPQKGSIAREIEEFKLRKELEEKSARLSKLTYAFLERDDAGKPKQPKKLADKYVEGAYRGRFDAVFNFRQNLKLKKPEEPDRKGVREANITRLSEINHHVSALDAYNIVRESVKIESFIKANLYQQDGNWVVQFELPEDKRQTYVLSQDGEVTENETLNAVNVVEGNNTLKVNQNELQNVRGELKKIKTELTTEVEEKDKADKDKANKVDMKKHIENKMNAYKEKAVARGEQRTLEK